MEKHLRSIVLLDKPPGPTSLECAEAVRKIFSAKKAGHAGTLDPGVTGVLIMALDEATKAMPVLMGLPKEYEGAMHVHRDFSEKELLAAVKSLTGKIVQRPPVKSAVARNPRERDVYSFEILKISGRDASFRVRCQAGTYIRKLCSDLGEKMQTQAHMKSLSRTRLGPFSIKECANLESIKKEPERSMLSIEEAFRRIGVKRIFLKGEAVQKIMNGSPVLPEHVEKADPGIRKDEQVGIYSKSRIIALGQAAGSSGNEKRPVAATDRIFKP